jgi:hypothetical protein
MANERYWETRSPVLLTADGGADGSVIIADVCGWKVKQQIVISAPSLPDLPLEIKRVISSTKLIVGPKVTTGKMIARADLSAYTTALLSTIRAEEQPKVRIPPTDIIQAAYEQEPTLALRTIGVDCIGDPWGKDNPLPVLATISSTASDFSPTQGKIQNITTPGVADTEFTIALPVNTKRYYIRVRDDVAKGRIAMATTETASKYWTLTRGTVFDSQAMNIVPSSNIFMSVSKPSVIVELISFTL